MTSSALPACGYCGAWHSGTCPKIKVIEYHDDGSVRRVELHDEPWNLTREPATPLHIGPSEVVVNGERYVRESTLFAAMQRADALGAAIEHVIADSPGTPEAVKEYLRKALR